jgi:hypothetical protein
VIFFFLLWFIAFLPSLVPVVVVQPPSGAAEIDRYSRCCCCLFQLWVFLCSPRAQLEAFKVCMFSCWLPLHTYRPESCWLVVVALLLVVVRAAMVAAGGSSGATTTVAGARGVLLVLVVLLCGAVAL